MENNNNFHRQWFKFYGQDWLTDIKILSLSAFDRLAYITLLCMASSSDEQGVVKGCSEDLILKLSHIDKKDGEGCFDRFADLGMISVTQSNAGRNGALNTTVTINAFIKRQEKLLTNAERQANFRKRQKEEQESLANKGKVTPRNAKVTKKSNESNTRGEERRGEENIDTGVSPQKSSFDIFWDAYPNKELKKRSSEIWKNKNLGKHLAEILTFIEKAKTTVRWKKGFVKQPPAFLNGECWNDDLATYNVNFDKSTPANVLSTGNSKTLAQAMKDRTAKNS